MATEPITQEVIDSLQPVAPFVLTLQLPIEGIFTAPSSLDDDEEDEEDLDDDDDEDEDEEDEEEAGYDDEDDDEEDEDEDEDGYDDDLPRTPRTRRM